MVSVGNFQRAKHTVVHHSKRSGIVERVLSYIAEGGGMEVVGGRSIEFDCRTCVLLLEEIRQNINAHPKVYSLYQTDVLQKFHSSMRSKTLVCGCMLCHHIRRKGG